jgi:hypothetical protein
VATVIAGLSLESRATDFAGWTVFIAHDTCPDYHGGESEARTRRNFAGFLRGAKWGFRLARPGSKA